MATIQVTDLHSIDSTFFNNSRKLTSKELDFIKGGFQITLATPASLALRTFPGLGYVYNAFTGGYQLGQWLNDNTPIQAWISEFPFLS